MGRTRSLPAATAAACGGSTTPEPRIAAGATGGTRLKARWYAAPEGPVRPHGTWNGPFHDTALDVDCGFLLAGDGAWRCLPFTAAVSDEAAFSLRYLADDKCTTPRVPSAARCSYHAPAQIGLWTATCPVLERRVTVGAAIAVDASVFLRGSDGTAAPFSPATAVRNALHLLGAEIDYPAYVAAERRDGATQQGYAEAALIALDGAVLGEASTDACEWRYRVRPLGAGLANVFGYGGGSSGCGPIGLSGQIAFVLGSELPATAFPAAPPLSTSNIGRLSRSANGVAGTWRWGSDGVRDTQLDSDVNPGPCEQRGPALASLRSLPGRLGGPVLLRPGVHQAAPHALEPVCPASRRHARLLSDCRVGQEVRPLTRFAGQIFEKRVLCAPATQAVGTPYAFGDPIPTESFLPATVVLR